MGGLNSWGFGNGMVGDMFVKGRTRFVSFRLWMNVYMYVEKERLGKEPETTTTTTTKGRNQSSSNNKSKSQKRPPKVRRAWLFEGTC